MCKNSDAQQAVGCPRHLVSGCGVLTWCHRWCVGRVKVTVEVFVGDGFFDGLSPEFRKLTGRLSQRYQRGQGMGVGQAEQLSHLRLLGDGHGREVAAVAFVAGGQKYVPRQGVDRRHARPGRCGYQVLVEGRHDFQVNRDVQHDWGLDERGNEDVRRVGGVLSGATLWDAPGSRHRAGIESCTSAVEATT